MKYSLLVFLLSTAALSAREQHLLPIEPLDIGDPDYVLPGVFQLETMGSRLIVRSAKHTEILILEPDGTPLVKFGGRGGHPSEFGEVGVLALAVDGENIWAIDSQREHVRRFEKETYRTSFPLPDYNVHFSYPTSNVFAATGVAVVIPAHPSTGFLATVFDIDGNLERQVGELPPESRLLRETIPGADDTFWSTDGSNWFAIHKYLPLVSIFDRDFTLIHRYQVDAPVIDRIAERVRSFVPRGDNRLPMPVFTDAKLSEGALYLMSWGRLHRVEPMSGEVTDVYAFKGEGEDFASVTAPFVTLFSFALLPDHQIVLAHPAMLWNHDLWTTRLPSPR